MSIQNGKPGEIWQHVKATARLIQLMELIGSFSMEEWRVFGNDAFNKEDGRPVISLGRGWRKRVIGQEKEIWSNQDGSRVIELQKLIANHFNGEDWEVKVLVGDKNFTLASLPSNWHRMTEHEQVEVTPAKVQKAKKQVAKDCKAEKGAFPVGEPLRYKKSLRFGRENLICKVLGYNGSKVNTEWTDGTSKWNYVWSKSKLVSELELVPQKKEEFPVGSKWKLKHSVTPTYTLWCEVTERTATKITVLWHCTAPNFRDFTNTWTISAARNALEPHVEKEKSFKDQFPVGSQWMFRSDDPLKRTHLWCKILGYVETPAALKLEWHSNDSSLVWENSWSVECAKKDLVPHDKYQVGMVFVSKALDLIDLDKCSPPVGQVTKVEPDKIHIRWTGYTSSCAWPRADVEAKLIPHIQPLKYARGAKLTPKTTKIDDKGYRLMGEVINAGPQSSVIEWHSATAGAWRSRVLNSTANEVLVPFVDTVAKGDQIWEAPEGHRVRLLKYLGKDATSKSLQPEEEWDAMCTCGCARKFAVLLPGTWKRIV